MILILIPRARSEIILESFLHFSLRAADTSSTLQPRRRRKMPVTTLLWEVEVNMLTVCLSDYMTVEGGGGCD